MEGFSAALIWIGTTLVRAILGRSLGSVLEQCVNPADLEPAFGPQYPDYLLQVNIKYTFLTEVGATVCWWSTIPCIRGLRYRVALRNTHRSASQREFRKLSPLRSHATRSLANSYHSSRSVSTSILSRNYQGRRTRS